MSPAGDNVRTDQIENGAVSSHEEDSSSNWVDLFAAGPATIISGTSSDSETGVPGEPELAAAEKGQRAYEEAVEQRVQFVAYYKDRPLDPRRDRHRRHSTMPIPRGQRPV